MVFGGLDCGLRSQRDSEVAKGVVGEGQWDSKGNAKRRITQKSTEGASALGEWTYLSEVVGRTPFVCE